MRMRDYLVDTRNVRVFIFLNPLHFPHIWILFYCKEGSYIYLLESVIYSLQVGGECGNMNSVIRKPPTFSYFNLKQE